MKQYDHKKIEKKWQNIWEKTGINAVKDAGKKYYCLDMFPYPSGSGLHVGHWRGYVLSDVAARIKKIEGYNVLHPMGWDAFGLPAENDAIKNKTHPRKNTEKNIASIKKQLEQIGACFDWSREIDTTDPSYYKWTQWIFKRMFDEGLAYTKEAPINWCPSCKTGLANEEVTGGVCERCGTEVTKKNLKQWMLKITDYADRLLSDLDKLDWPEKVKKMQSDWIGKSEGATIRFTVKGKKSDIKCTIDVFTTRADTLFGCTYIVIAPESEIISDLKLHIANLSKVEEYIEETKKKSAIDRIHTEKEKTGVKIEGVTAINPINGKEIPIFIADYVLADYGTGAVMAVPAHDERDWDFAKKYDLPIKEVVLPSIIDKRNPPVKGKKVVERKNIHAIVRDPKSGKYLGLKWKQFNWITFPMGGVEDGEDIVEAARREVAEETGYINLKLIKILDGRARAEYFAAHKDENRVSYTTCIVFELINHAQSEVDEKEKAAHDIIWLNQSELNYEHMTHAEIDLWQEKLSAKNPAYTRAGILIDSEEFTALTSEQAQKKITEKLKKDGLGDFTTNYKLRDWIFSRQRYWGEPIPLVFCEHCAEKMKNAEFRIQNDFSKGELLNPGWFAVEEKDLPLELPKVDSYEPTGTGESPLAAIDEWTTTTCPKCGWVARRESNTMPQWAGSSWYFLRYVDPKNTKGIAGSKELKKWLPVDLYVGGIEHAVLHLLYARFWTKFLYDIGAVTIEEPFKRLFNQGMVYRMGAKMSKSKGNIVSQEEIIERYGSDTLRAYELFIAPPEQDAEWQDNGVPGVHKFLKKVWVLTHEVFAGDVETRHGVSAPEIILWESFEIGETELQTETHKAIKKFNEDLSRFHYNTLVSTLMEFANYLSSKKELLKKYPEPLFILITLLSPIAPHISEELWEMAGFNTSIFSGKYGWPKHNEEYLSQDIVAIVIQENGRYRGEIMVATDAKEKEVISAINEIERLKDIAKNARKTILVKNKLINFVTTNKG